MESSPAAWAVSVEQPNVQGRMIRIVLPAAVLLLMGVWLNLLYVERLKEPAQLAVYLGLWLFQQLIFLGLGTLLVYQVGRNMSAVPMKWREVLAYWLMTSLVHVISGSFAIYQLTTVPWSTSLAEIPFVVSVFPNEGGTFFWDIVNLVAFDELLHLGLFAGLACWRLRFRRWWQVAGIALAMVGPYLVAVVLSEKFFRLMTGR